MADAVAGAILEFVTKGSDLASAKANTVKADLTSAERAGKHAEKASHEAEGAAHKAEHATHQLEHAATHALISVRRAGGLLRHLGGGGALGALAGEIGSGAGVAGHLLHLLGGAAELIPGGGILAGGAALAAGLYTASERSESDDEKADRIAEKTAEHLKKGQDGDEIRNEMLRQVGLSKIDRSVGGGARLIP